MRITLKVPTASIRQKARKARAELRNGRRDVLTTIGVQLASLAQQAYLEKSKGLRGSDGITWAPLKPATLAKRNRRGKANASRTSTKSGKARPAGGSVDIGRDTGLQISSVSPGITTNGGNAMVVTNSDVTVRYNRAYSKYFDEKRALLPDKLPASWRAKCMAILNRWVRSVLDRTL